MSVHPLRQLPLSQPEGERPAARLRPAPHLDLTLVEDRGVVVVADRRHEVYSGPEYVEAVRAVQGDEPAATPAVQRAIDELRAAGVFLADSTADDAASAYWARDGLDAGAVQRRTAALPVEVVTLGAADPAPVLAALDQAGVTVVDDGGELALVLVEDYLDDRLAEHNAAALAGGRPWMIAAPDRAEAWIGPVFAPDRGPCWECLAQRLRLHRRIDDALREQGGRSERPGRHAGALPSTRLAAVGVAVTQLLRWFALGPASRADRVLTLDTRTWASESHAVLWRPQCPACGEPDASLDAPARPPALAARGTAPTVGGMRTIAPEATLERHGHHVSPVSGIVPLLVRAAEMRPPLHAYLSGDPGPAVHGAEGWTPGSTTPPGGKGTTDAQAKASALCEALERYCGEFGGEEPRRTASLEELGDAGIHPNDCMRFSEAQYARREEINRAADSFRTYVPERFDPTAPVEWSPAWSLTAQSERLLPTAYCYYRAPVAGQATSLADSNGNAAGNTVDEAVLQGLLELVERDHAALWWYNRLRLPGLDLDAFGDPWLAQLRLHLAGEDRELWALDLTADLGIPAVAALATRADEPDKITMGLGAHVELGGALVRAATELVQLQWVPSGGLGRGPQVRLDAEAAWLRPDPDAPPHTPADSPLESSGDLRTDLDACVQRVEGHGLEVLVLDQTRPDVGVPVLKVLAPGLRHFWPRFGAGRLYDVPVALGRLPQPRTEDELTPVPPVL